MEIVTSIRFCSLREGTYLIMPSNEEERINVNMVTKQESKVITSLNVFLYFVDSYVD